MRISDWSSDVCSSDLAVTNTTTTDVDDTAAHTNDRETVQSVLIRSRQDGEAGHKMHLGERAPRNPSLDRRTILGDEVFPVVCAEFEDLPVLEENGRASCRERVCQYV